MNNIGSRYKKMDDFLKAWRDIALENPQYSFSDEGMRNAIYKNLVRIGIDQKDINRDISNEGMFNRWIARFKNQPNIDVFVTENWKYFCQFTNRKEVFNHGRNEAIKIYVPLDIEHLEQGANQIFDFMAEKNIAHASKIGRNLRVDNIVIRVSNEEDAKAVLNFINKNKYIQEGLYNPNPFVYNNGKIAMACDRNLSYNNTIATFIAMYIEQRKKENKLQSVKLSDFVRYVAEYHKDRFQQFNNEEETLKDFGIKPNSDDYSTSFKLLNLRDVTTLFLESTGIMYSFNNYLQHFRRSNLFERQVNDLTNLRRTRRGYIINDDEDTLEPIKPIEPKLLDKKEVDIEKMTFDMLDTWAEKHHSKEHMLKILEAYLKTGDEMYITSQNNLREKVSSSLYRESIQRYLRENNQSIEEYFEKMLERREEQVLEDAVWITYQKYQRKYEEKEIESDGRDWVKCALKGIALMNKYNGFTQDQNARKRLMDYEIEKTKAIEIMKRKTFTKINQYTPIELYFELFENYADRVITDKSQKHGRTMAS